MKPEWKKGLTGIRERMNPGAEPLHEPVNEKPEGFKLTESTARKIVTARR